MRRILALLLMALAVPSLLLARNSIKIKKSHFDLKDAPNVLLVTFDTTRADHLSCYGYVRDTSPTVDKLAAHGVLFENAYTAEPLTGPSHITMMTSLYPQQHGATINGMHMTTHPRPVLLAQVFRHLGYKTAAFISAWTLKKGITGLGRGFDVYNQNFTYYYKVVNAGRRGNETGAAARKWLRKHGHSHFFLWVHYFDAHEPYISHKGFDHLPHIRNATIFPPPASANPQRAEKIRYYDSGIAFEDHDLSKTLKLLDEMGLRNKTLILVVADHGEDLGERGIWGHGYHIDQEAMHVPMVISYPKEIPQGVRIKANVSTVDIMPTILSYVGLNFSVPGQSGYNLKSMIQSRGKDAPPRPSYFVVYAEPKLLPPQWMSAFWTWAEPKRTPSKMGFVLGNVKVVEEGSHDALKIYRLSNDFSHAQQLPDSSMKVAKLSSYKEDIDSWFDKTNRGLAPQGHLTKQDVEMLKSLGYASP